MAVTWFFEGIDCGSDAVLKFRVSCFQQMIRYPEVRAMREQSDHRSCAMESANF